MPELLRASNINKHYDGTHALRDVSLSILPGEVHALVGENGAGKSTLSKVIAGVVQPDSGELTWNGSPVSIQTPLDAQRLGIGIIFQELDLFPHLTIADNLVIGNLVSERGMFLDRKSMDQFCAPLLREAGLNCPSSRLVADLSLAQMQLVAIARALGMNARLIIMDEPTSSLSEDGAETLFGLIRGLKEKGVSIIYVSHKMDEIFRISDRISVLRDGEMIATNAAKETNVGEVIALMVGRELQQIATRKEIEQARVLLRVKELSTPQLEDISFDLHAGEVLGVAGLVGSGRSSLGAALFGLEKIQSGSMELRGEPFQPRSPAHAVSRGLGLAPEDRKAQGLMMQMSIIENSTFNVLGQLQRAGFIDQSEEKRRATEAHQTLRLKARSGADAVSTLSGGNQQKVLLSRWLLADPDVLFLDDPARGIDIGAKHDIYELLVKLTAAGKGIILVSSELPELLRCSDRILVLHEGRSMGILARDEATQEGIMAMATRSV
jgi:ABC-type sugar transport system ATPase subunit